MAEDHNEGFVDSSQGCGSSIETAINRASELLGGTSWSAQMLDGEPEAVYVWEDVRGGRALIVAADKSVLFASSAVSPGEHESAFRSGRRTEVDSFNHGG